MLTEVELLAFYQRMGLSLRARQVIEQVRSSQPSRRVRPMRGNVTSNYPSKKMGLTIQTESHKVELPFAVQLELDEEVHEYWDQPPPIKLTYIGKNGRQMAFMHSADFFIISESFVGWVECKQEADLAVLAGERPWRFQRDANGEWHCPPGEEYAQQLGFGYRVWSSAEIDWNFYNNVMFLADYYRVTPDELPIDEAVAEMAARLVKDEPGISLADLLERVGADPEINTNINGTPNADKAIGEVADTIYSLIVTGRLYADLRAGWLSEPYRMRLFLDPEAARTYVIRSASEAAPWSVMPGQSILNSIDIAVGARVVWDEQSFLIINMGRYEIALLAEGQLSGSAKSHGLVGSSEVDEAGRSDRLVQLPYELFERLVTDGKIKGMTKPEARLSPEILEIRHRASLANEVEANARFAAIATELLEPQGDQLQAGIHNGDSGPVVPARTKRRWKLKYRTAEKTHGCGYDGLLSLHWRKGNRNPKLSEDVQALMAQSIVNRYETLKQKSKRAVYGEFALECDKRGLPTPSYKTFCRYVDDRPVHEREQKRKGSRAAYKYEPFHWELDRTTPRQGDRPYHIVYLDHTQADDELVCSLTGKNLGRPWLSIATSGYDRRVLAVFTGYDQPNSRTNMMLIRELVRRHGRFPQIIVVDGGKDFHSTYFDTLLARNGCIKKTRPGKPRFGSVIESLFGTSNTEFFHQLKGSTKIMRNVRQVTKAVNPKGHAVWNLEAFHLRLCEFAYEAYETPSHPALGQSPREAYIAGMAQSGARNHRRIVYDDEFIKQTLPTTTKGTAKVQTNGVKINYIYYWCDDFSDPKVLNRQVPVRWDPWDTGVAYAYVNGRWVRCISEYYAAFKGRSEKEVRLLAEALRKRNKQHGRDFVVNAKKLAEFMLSVEGEEIVHEQHVKDREIQPILRRINSSDNNGGSDGNDLAKVLPFPTGNGASNRSYSIEATDDAGGTFPSSVRKGGGSKKTKNGESKDEGATLGGDSANRNSRPDLELCEDF